MVEEAVESRRHQIALLKGLDSVTIWSDVVFEPPTGEHLAAGQRFCRIVVR
jgi:hypothetical protein